MHRSMSFPRFPLLVSVLLLALACPSWAQQPGTPVSVELRPGVIVDTQQQIAYVGQPDSTIDAIDLSRGNVLWTSDEAAWPLLLDDGQLIAQAAPTTGGELLIAVLDPSRRGDLHFAAQIELPSDVESVVDDRLGQSFTVQARHDQERVLVTWSDSKRPVQGMQMPESSTDGVRESNGAALLDITLQQVTPIAGDLANTPGPNAPNLPPNQRLPGLGETQFRSADGRHVMISRRIADDRVEAKYQWTLYAYPSGEQVGTAHQIVSYSPFLVAGSQLVVESRPSIQRRGDRLVDFPLELRAHDLANGSETWRHPVRDTTYRGPFPP